MEIAKRVLISHHAALYGAKTPQNLRRFLPNKTAHCLKELLIQLLLCLSANIVCSKKKAFSVSFPLPFIGVYGGIKWSIHTTSPTCFMYQKTALPYSGKRGFIDMRLAKEITH